MMVHSSVAFVALGGNLGPVLSTFRMALRQLEARGMAVVGVSSAYRSEALQSGDNAFAGPPYWNAVCQLGVANVDAQQLLQILLSIEHAAGRTRGRRWAPRTLDLDLLTFEQQIIEQPHLRLPHPGLAVRPFVLQPLHELSPTAHIPFWNLSVRALMARLPQPLAGIYEIRKTWLQEADAAFLPESTKLVHRAIV